MVDLANPTDMRSTFPLDRNHDDSIISSSGHMLISNPFGSHATHELGKCGGGGSGRGSGSDGGSGTSAGTSEPNLEMQIEMEVLQIDQQILQLTAEIQQLLPGGTSATSAGDNTPASSAPAATDSSAPAAAPAASDGSAPAAAPAASDASAPAAAPAASDGAAPTAPAPGSDSVAPAPATTTSSPPSDTQTTASDTSSTTVPPAISDGGNFSVTNGQIIGPDGKPFIAKGINVDGRLSNEEENAILNNFPGLNFIRLNTSPNGAPFGQNGDATSGSDSAAQIQQFIDTMTAKGIVVEVENHAAGGQITGQNLTDETNWLSQLASQNKDNPYVWFGSANEPSVHSATDDAEVVAEQQADYNTIRGAGNNNLIMLQPTYGTYGSQTDSFTQNPDFANYTNVAVDAHFYGDASAIASALSQYKGIDSADGQVPVIIGEYGPTVGTGGDPNPSVGAAQAEAVQQAVNAGQANGAVAWEAGFDTTSSNAWTDSDGLLVTPSSNGGNQVNPALTSWGQEVASWINTGTVGTDAPA
jgi:Cellulase (glycosyl hydrolase family 5)